MNDKIINSLKYLLALIIVVASLPVEGQNNLIITNPQFIENTDGWSITGNSTLSHITKGALTAGAAKLVVEPASDNYSKARLKSATFNMPSNMKEKLLLLTFYAKSPQKRTFKVSFKTIDDNDETITYNSASILLDTIFKKISLPLYVEDYVSAFRFEMFCGMYSGSYIFDDFLFTFKDVSTSDITLMDEWQSRYFELPQNVIWQNDYTGESSVTISIMPSDSIAPVLSTQFGVNSNFRSKNSIVDRVNLYAQMGAFRFPAGSGSNQYFFDCNIPDTFAIDFKTYCGTDDKFTDPAHYAAFIKDVGGEGAVVVNYFYARYGITPEGTRESRVKQAASYAASFVKKMNIDLNAGIKYWEVGNECYGSWETGYDVNGNIVTGKEYGEDFRVFADSMRKVDPDILIGAVLSHNDYDWSAQVIQEVENYADFFILHHYFKDVESAELSKKQLIELENDMKEVELLVSEYTDKPAGYFPIAFTEYNIQGPYTTNIVNGLFTADALAVMIKNHNSLATIWVNEWKIDENNTTHGILSLNDPDQPDYTARPVYTPFYYYGKFFGDRMIETTVSGSSQIRAYASLFSSGEIGVTIINYSDSEKKIKLDYGGTSNKPDTLYYFSVFAENKNIGNKRFFVNGYTGDTQGGGPVNLDEVPAFARKITDSSFVKIPQYSINFFVIKSNEGFLEIKNNEFHRNTIHVYPNPASNYLFAEGNLKELDGIMMFDLMGRNVNNAVVIEKIDNRKIVVDLSLLPSGVYILKNEFGCTKIIKK
jgi:hypothetical protein